MTAEQPPPPPPPPHAPKKNGARGLTILLGIVGGGLLLISLVVGVVIWRVWSDPEGNAKLRMIGRALELARHAKNAPGAKELRAAGCGEVLVLGLDEILRIAGEDASVDVPGPKLETTVVCVGKTLGTPPTCEDVAHTYVKAVKPRGLTMVSVSRGGTGEQTCTGVYDEHGEKTVAGVFDAPGAMPSDDEPPEDPPEDPPPTDHSRY
jgi:hypothetical protein